MLEYRLATDLGPLGWSRQSIEQHSDRVVGVNWGLVSVVDLSRVNQAAVHNCLGHLGLKLEHVVKQIEPCTLEGLLLQTGNG